MTDTDPFPAPPDGPDASATVPPVEPPPRRRSTVPIWIGLAVLVAVLGVAALALTAPDDEETASGSSGSASSSSSEAPVEVSIDGPRRTQPIPEGSAIPDWSASMLEGGTFDWSDRPAGPTVLTIWAPWCPHCQAELPRLSAAIERHPALSLVTIATAVDATEGPTPQEYLDGEDLDLTVGLDDDAGTLAAGLGVQGFPTTYFVDASGRVVASAAGELDPDGLEEVLTYLEGLAAA